MVIFTNLTIYLVFGMFARFFEEICQIHLIAIGGILTEADGTNQSIVVVLCIKEGQMHVAKINEIQSGTTHYKHGLKLIVLGQMGKAYDSSV